jgi:hypothetical protein
MELQGQSNAYNFTSYLAVRTFIEHAIVLSMCMLFIHFCDSM